jgi:DNA-binding MarR family transcriptional regulator
MPDRELFLKAATTSQYIGQLLDRGLEPIGLPAYLLALLTHIRDHAPVSPSRISVASGVPMTTLRDNIQRLVDRRLARRVKNREDGRSYLLVLTSRGKAMIASADPALLEAYLAVEQRLPRPLHVYEEMIDEVNEALQDAVQSPLAALEDEDEHLARGLRVHEP